MESVCAGKAPAECDACAASHLHQLRAEGCTSAETRAWCAAGGSQRDAGILYEVWHAPAAHLANRVKASGATQPLTAETVIRSDGSHSLGGVFTGPSPEIPPGFIPDIYSVEPQLGFYCLYRPRAGENVTEDTITCPNITGVALQHAKWLTDAGFDYVTVDITNWPVTGFIGSSTTVPNTDITILRPLEVLAEEWLKLRKKGIATPSIAVWPTTNCNVKGMCMGTKKESRPGGNGQYAMWRWVLDEFYNNLLYEDIVYKPFDADGKKLLFLPSPQAPAYNNASFVALLEANGGRHDVKVQSMWAMSNDFAAGAWGFFSFCNVPAGFGSCPPAPPPSPTHLPCPPGQKLDTISAPGDNGSCDCDTFCASDWTGGIKAARPHWTGAASAVLGAKTNCLCVQGTHFCPKAASCEDSCKTKPTPTNYCIKGAPPPVPPAKICPTTSMVDVPDCDQQASTDGSPHGNPQYEISASGAYMTAQCALPFASPGHMRGLTIQRLFKKVLDVGAPHMFMSSFNELIGGRQKSAYKANTAINMGLPYDAQNRTVWVDSYALEFSRDMEPTVEGGDRVWRVASSCVNMYKAGRKCSHADAAGELCCTTKDKEVFANVWSFSRIDGSDNTWTSNQSEASSLSAEHTGWKEHCNPVPGSAVFCTDSGLTDARQGPFMLYSVPVQDTPTRPLFRCWSEQGAFTGHFLSTDENCEGHGKLELTVGHIAVARGGEMLRALRRCKTRFPGRRTHSLDLLCDTPDDPTPLGFVR